MPPLATTTQCKLSEYKCSFCASGWIDWIEVGIDALCCAVLFLSMVVVVVVVGACYSCILYRLPCILPFASCACDVPTGANIPLAQVVFVTSCNLHWWCFFHSATSTDSPLAHMVVSPSATCTGGAFSSRQCCKNCTCSSTCTCGGGGIFCIAVNVCEALIFSLCGFGSNP